MREIRRKTPKNYSVERRVREVAIKTLPQEFATDADRLARVEVSV